MDPPLEFHKYQGLGNDFLVIDLVGDCATDPPIDTLAPALCDRRFGVGGDGVLASLPPIHNGSDGRMRVVNADGSVPEMCGNGVRCIALHLARKRGIPKGTLRIDTDAGTRTCEVDDANGVGSVTVDMGTVRVFEDCTIQLGDRAITLAVADVGNPHAILFGEFSAAEIDRLGPGIATHPHFPRGTNVEFVRVTTQGIDLVVWERGVGRTLACGTGACAAVAVACARSFVAYGERVTVRLPGGPLEIAIAPGGQASMRGPATHVFSGSWRR